MRKLLLSILTIFLLFLAGCDLFTNIDGWDFSACTSSSGFSTCYELFSDNQTRILGGKTALQSLIDSYEGLSNETLAK